MILPTYPNLSDKIKLSVSSKNIKNCDEIVQILKTCGIYSIVKSNKSIVNYNKKYVIENGCQISMFTNNMTEVNEVWTTVKKKYDLDCAHLSIRGKFSGCVYNFFSESKCPGTS